MTPFDLLIKDAKIVTESGISELTIAVKDGKIKGLFDPLISLSAEREICCKGKVILPGALDTHSHITSKENFDSGTKTAAKGGVTTVIEMPLSAHLPQVFDEKTYCDRISLGEEEAHVDFALWAGINPSTIGNAKRLHELGCTSFKAFMNYAGESYPYMDDYSLLSAMEELKKFDGLIGVHAENEALCSKLTAKYRSEGKGPAFHEPSRPRIAELEAISRAVLFAKTTSCRLHVCHVSIPEGVDLIENARKEGARITIETCPHYLALDKTAIEKYGAYAKCNPPMRSKDCADKMWDYLKAGMIDTIGSDHSAYSDEEKSCSIWNAPGGFPGMDLILPILISEGVHKHGLSWEQLAKVTSTNAAKSFGLYPRKGHIAIGADADFAIVDPDKEWTFTVDDTFYLYKSSKYAYEGMKFKGSVIASIVRGETVYESGKVLSTCKFGKYISAK